MTQKISNAQKRKMYNPVIQFFKYIILSLKIMGIVAGGHGGTKNLE